MHDLEHRVSLVWVVDSYWRTISTTHLGVPRLMGGGVGRLAAAWPASSHWIHFAWQRTDRISHCMHLLIDLTDQSI